MTWNLSTKKTHAAKKIATFYSQIRHNGEFKGK